MVRPVIMRSSAARTRSSVSVSTELVASSRIRIPGSVRQGARKADQLLLPGGERSAALAAPARRSRRGSVRMKSPTFTSSAARSTCASVIHFGAEPDVVRDRAGEQERVLQHDAEAPAQRVQVLLAHVHAVHQDLPALDVVEAHHQRGDGGLAGAGVADDGGGLVRLDDEADAAQDPLDAVEVVRARSVGGRTKAVCSRVSC